MKKKPSNPDLLLERRLIDFFRDKSKEKYVLLLEAFRCTDVLVPAAPTANELPFGNEGILKQTVFRPDVIYMASENKRLMPIFSDPTKIPSDYASGKTVFMHCSGWIKAFYAGNSEGVILNPFSDISFLLTPDQIRILSLFRQTTSEYR
ncbi:MAG: SseB family protein [Alphaproteobacteria bacterium]|nr:SseB family protein [Alphaproteobacteria bacterium]